MVGRKKLNRVKLEARVDAETPKKLKAMALKMGYQWGSDGATGEFLDAIANGEIEVKSVSEK